MSTTKPIRIGSKITELAKISTVLHMVGNRTAPPAAMGGNLPKKPLAPS
jgi:hypothetical protein